MKLEFEKQKHADLIKQDQEKMNVEKEKYVVEFKLQRDKMNGDLLMKSLELQIPEMRAVNERRFQFAEKAIDVSTDSETLCRMLHALPQCQAPWPLPSATQVPQPAPMLTSTQSNNPNSPRSFNMEYSHEPGSPTAWIDVGR